MPEGHLNPDHHSVTVYYSPDHVLDMADLVSSAHKLEPFVLMSKSAKGAAAAKLIENATAAPGVFVFGELLEQPNVQEVRDSDSRQLHTTDGAHLTDGHCGFDLRSWRGTLRMRPISNF